MAELALQVVTVAVIASVLQIVKLALW